MPRLLILCEYPTLLGGERSMFATLPAVTAAGFDVHVAAPGGGELAEALRDRGVAHVPLRTHEDSGERLPLLQLRSEIDSLLRQLNPNLVHANSLSMSRIAGPVAASKGRPSLGHLRDIIKVSRQAIDDLNSHSLLIAVSNATRDFHVGQGLDGKKCVVNFNGVDLDEFSPRRPTGYLHRELNLPPHVRLIAVIGQIGIRKGTEVAIAAAGNIVSEMPDVHWLIVGERTSNKTESREFETQLCAAANHPLILGRVHFLGQRRDVRDLLVECHLFVHAARQEPLGRVLLESAASGLPVVATDVGGTREIFPTENDGAVLVPADDPASLATTIVELLLDNERRQKLGEAGRRRAEQRFDIRQSSARLLEIYQSVSTCAPVLFGWAIVMS